MSQTRYRIVFEYPQQGQNMVSDCPPKLLNLDEPSNGGFLKLDPEAHSWEGDSDIQAWDEEDDEDDDPGYQEIRQILCPGETEDMRGYQNVDMTNVMEYDERDDVVEWDGSLDTEFACMVSIADD
ncbi:hypothetical protein IL306_009265 [Fusarium sp. DS 682]|nr:hypothetical protein IL306_009265 [Fusarium sp. DS 682]